MSYWDMVERKRNLAESFVNSPSEDRFEDLAEELWASQARSVSHWLDTLVFDTQTPHQVASAFEDAIKNDDPTVVRDLDGFGWATTTEVLRALEPDQFAILNDRSYQGIEALGYDPPNPKTATLDQYEAFVEAVIEAYEEYELERVVRETTGEPIPDWATVLEIADRAFSDHVDGRVNLGNLDPVTKESAPTIDDDLIKEIETAVENNPTYRDVEDFIYAAIRAELKQAQR